MDVVLQWAKWIVVGYVVLYAVFGMIIVIARLCRGGAKPLTQEQQVAADGRQLVAGIEKFLREQVAR